MHDTNHLSKPKRTSSASWRAVKRIENSTRIETAPSRKPLGGGRSNFLESKLILLQGKNRKAGRTPCVAKKRSAKRSDPGPETPLGRRKGWSLKKERRLWKKQPSPGLRKELSPKLRPKNQRKEREEELP